MRYSILLILFSVSLLLSLFGCFGNCDNLSASFINCGDHGRYAFSLGTCWCFCDEGYCGRRCQEKTLERDFNCAISPDLSATFDEQTCSCKCDDKEWCGLACSIPVETCSESLRGFWNKEFCGCDCNTSGTYPDCALEQDIGITVNSRLKNKYLTKSELDYFPLQVGTESYYAEINEAGDTSRPFGIQVIDTVTIDNHLMYDTDFVYFDSSGNPIDTAIGILLFSPPDSANWVFTYVDSANMSFFGFHQFTFGDTLFYEIDMYSGDTLFFVVDSIGTVTVPAGIFMNCAYMRNQDNSGPVYAPGVGLVKVIDKGRDAQILTSFISSCNISVTVVFSDVSCFGATDGTIKIKPDDEGGEYTYTWLGPDFIGNTATATNLSPGTYSVLVERDDGCFTEFENIIVAEPAALNIQTIALQNVSCTSAADAAIDISVTGGSGVYTYNWNNGAYSTQDIASLGPGTYHLLVTDDNGCSTQDSFTITEPSGLEVTLVSKQNTSCLGTSTGAIDIVVNGGTGIYTYDWNSGSYSTQDLQNLAAGLYTVLVTDENGCQDMLSVMIDDPDAISIALTSKTNVSCIGESTGSIDISISGGTGMYSYNWNSGAYSTQDLQNLPAGSYDVIVKDENNCEATLSITIDEPDTLAVSLVMKTDVACTGETTGSIDIAVSGGTAAYSYDWNSGAYNTQDLQNLPAGSYDVIVTDENNCTETLSVTIDEPEALVVSLITKTDIACKGESTGSIDISVSGGTGIYSYDWNSGVYSSQDLQNLASGTYDVVVTDENNCTEMLSVTIDEPEELFISLINRSDVSCKGASDGSIDILVSGGSPAYSYDWNSGTYSTQDLQNLPAGVYDIIVTDANNCEKTLSVTIDEPDDLEATLVTKTDVSCHGESTGSISISVSGGSGAYLYNWNNGAYTTQNVENVPAGTYELLVTDENNCEDLLSVTIDEPDALQVSLLGKVDVNCVGESNGSIDIQASGGTGSYSYNWNNGTYTTQDLQNLPAGIYIVTATDENGCEGKSSISIDEPDELVVSLASKTDISCNGENDGSIDIDVMGGNGGYNYNWNNGAFTTEDIQNIPAGDYNVVVTDDKGCQGMLSVTIVQSDQLNVSLASKTDVSCFGESDGAIDLNVTGGTGMYSYEWSDAIFNTQDLQNLPADIFGVTVTDENDCSGTLSISINEPDELSVSLIQKKDISCQGESDGMIDVIVTGGNGNYFYDWNNGAFATQDLEGIRGGTYELLVNDENNCSATLSVTIVEPDKLTVSLAEKVNVGCTGESTGSIDITATGGSGNYSYNWNSGSFTTEDLQNLPVGDYEVMVTDDNDCEASLTVTIGEPEVLAVALVSKTDIACAGESTGSIDLNVTGGSGSYAYNWNSGTFNTQDLQNLPAGSYDVIVTDENDCTDMLSVSITEPDALTVSLIEKTDVVCFGESTGSLDIDVQGGSGAYSYDWNSGAYSTQDLDNLPAGTYDLIVKDENDCEETLSVEIVQSEALVITLSSTAAKGSNNDGTASVEVSGGSAPYSYLWSDSTQQMTAQADSLKAGEYMVTVTDENGCTATESVTVEMSTSTEDLSAEQVFQVFPNPVFAGMKIHVLLEEDISIHDVRINAFDLQGRLLRIQKDRDQYGYQISTAGLTSGVYILGVEYRQRFYTQKIVVMY